MSVSEDSPVKRHSLLYKIQLYRRNDDGSVYPMISGLFDQTAQIGATLIATKVVRLTEGEGIETKENVR